MTDNHMIYALATSSSLIALLGLSYYYYSRRQGYRLISSSDEQDRASSRKRAMSYSSELLINGVFPPAVKEPPSLINIVLLFKQLPSKEELIEKFQTLLAYDRMRSTPKYDPKTRKWAFKYISAVDIAANHLTEVEAASEVELMKKMEEMLMKDIPGYTNIPLWQIIRLHNTGKGVSAVIFRIHHVIGDGIALIGSLSKLFTNAETGEVLDLDIPGRMNAASGAVRGNQLLSKLAMMLKVTISFFQVLYLAISSYDSDILFTSKSKRALIMTKTRKVILFPTIRLDFIKRLKNKASVTINDLLFTVMSGAILRYCQAKEDPMLTGRSKQKVSNRALIPLAFPRPSEELEDYHTAMRNKWAFISVQMPLNEANPIERLKKCHKTTQAIKSSPNPVIQHWIQNQLLPYAPSSLAKQTALDLMSRHSLVFSNLPGAEYPIAMCNQKLLGLQIIFHNILPQVLLISYGGAIFCNMSIDTDEIKDADTLLPKYYIEELKEMAKSLGIDATDAEILTGMSEGEVFGLL
jgi:diacylglycerol O-acyltransferase / wax synthase